jgi:hypothetical protein
MTEQELSDEAMAIFLCGEMIALCSQINPLVLQRFLDSERSKGDFRYRKQCLAVLNLCNSLITT